MREATRLSGLAVLGGFAGCAESGEALSDAVDMGDDDGQPVDPSELRLESGLRTGLGSTAFVGLVGRSEVDADEPGGGRLVTVDDVTPGEEVTLSWRRTVEREQASNETPTNDSFEDSESDSAVEPIEETGTITASGLADAHGLFMPMYWQPGEIQTNSSAIWLYRAAFQDLKEAGQTAWSRDVLTRISRVGVEIASQIDSGVAEQIRNGTAEVDEVLLHAEPEPVDVELAVNGEPVTVSAIEA